MYTARFDVRIWEDGSLAMVFYEAGAVCKQPYALFDIHFL